jgi:F-type H+-transporting ATPase subunit b
MLGALHNPEFWVLVSFLIFFGLFGARLWGTITGMLDARAAAVRTELDEAAKLRAEAEQMLKDAQAQREAALQEAREMLERSRAEAARVTRDAAAEAEASTKRRERQALDRIAAAEKAVVTEIRDLASELATQAARQVIATTLSAEDDAALVNDAIGNLPRALRAA